MIEARREFLAHFVQGPAGEVTIDVGADGGQLFGAYRLVQFHHAVADFMIARDYHHQHTAVGQGDQLDVLQLRARIRNGGGDAHAARHIHEHARSVFDALLDRFEAPVFGAQALELGGGHSAQRQRLDVAAKSLFGGNAPGGGMGLVQIAFFVEVGHDVANRGGAERIGTRVTPAAHDGARGDGLAGFDIGCDDFVQKLAAARNHVNGRTPIIYSKDNGSLGSR